MLANTAHTDGDCCTKVKNNVCMYLGHPYITQARNSLKKKQLPNSAWPKR